MSYLDNIVLRHDQLCGYALLCINDPALVEQYCDCGAKEAAAELKKLRDDNHAKSRELKNNASTDALNDICGLLKEADWDYPAQVVRFVRDALSHNYSRIGELDAKNKKYIEWFAEQGKIISDLRDELDTLKSAAQGLVNDLPGRILISPSLTTLDTLLEILNKRPKKSVTDAKPLV